MAQSGNSVVALEEVVVTSRKVEEKLNDIPIAVSAFTAQDLQDRNVTSLADIAAFTPGFSYEAYSGGTTPAPLIRGLTQNALTDRNQNVATFVDGIHVQQQGNIDFSLLDIERVEIIKGPQNAQYGKRDQLGAQTTGAGSVGRYSRFHRGIRRTARRNGRRQHSGLAGQARRAPLRRADEIRRHVQEQLSKLRRWRSFDRRRVQLGRQRGQAWRL
jgi:outer membrane receptor protein involved in Fe transport